MDILGHDIDGRPLRVGDEVVVVSVKRSAYADLIGEVIAIIGSGHRQGTVTVDVPPRLGGIAVVTEPSRLRKITDDHQPADESFEDMMRNLNSQDMTKRNKELVFKF